MGLRVKWVDYAKAFSIFFVVLLHAGIPDPVKGVIRVFLIPLFFFLSGIFSNPQKYPNYSAFIKQRGIKILIPYFFFNVITYLFWVFIGSHFGLDSNSEINYLQALSGIFYGTSGLLKHYVPLWFLACLFSVESIYYIAFRKIKTVQWRLILTFLFGVLGYINYSFNSYPLPWSIDIALSMIVFYSIGSLSQALTRSMQIKGFGYIYIVLVSFALVFLMFKINAEVKVFINYYGNYLYFFIGAFAGILFSISIVKIIDMYFKPIKFLQFIGENTLIILVLHLISGSIVKAISFYIFHLPLSIYEIIWVKLLYAILSIVLLVPVILFFNKYLPFIVGKPKVKS